MASATRCSCRRVSVALVVVNHAGLLIGKCNDDFAKSLQIKGFKMMLGSPISHPPVFLRVQNILVMLGNVDFWLLLNMGRDGMIPSALAFGILVSHPLPPCFGSFTPS